MIPSVVFVVVLAVVTPPSTSLGEPVQPKPLASDPPRRMVSIGCGLPTHPGPPSSYARIVFSADGKWLAASRTNHPAAYVWEVATGKRTASLGVDGFGGFGGGFGGFGGLGGDPMPTDIAISPDGSMVFTCGDLGFENSKASYATVLWDVKASKTANVLKGSRRTDRLAFSPDGASVATASREAVLIYDAKSGTSTATLKDAKGYAEAITFSSDGATVAVGHDGWVGVWETKTGKQIARSQPHKRRLATIAFARDAQSVLSLARHGVVRRWDLTTKKSEETRLPMEDWGGQAAFSPDGEFLATGEPNGEVVLWRVASGKASATLFKHRSAVTAVAFSPDGKLVASGSEELGIRLDRVPE